MEKNLTARYLAAKRALFDKVYGDLNDMQRQAVFTTEGPLLVLAGAGSGKTTVLVRRIAFIIRYGNAYYTDFTPACLSEEHVADLEHAIHLSVSEIEQILPEFIHDPCPPYRMLAITFTNKAAGEIKNRLVKQFADETLAADIWSGTFHSVCMRILRTYGDRVGFGKGFTIYDTDDTKKAVVGVMKKLNIDEKQFPPKSVITAISHAKDKLMTAEDFEVEAGVDFRLSRIAAIYKGYEEVLKASNAMDFDDIILHTVRLLRENPDVLNYYQRKFKYVCIDEYQDTNVAQFVLSSLLSGGYHNLMVVGDDDQSIYKFRGATIENIRNFVKVFENATAIRLEQNYRSTQTILDAANAVISHNSKDEAMRKRLWTDRGEGTRISVLNPDHQNAEARAILDIVQRKVARGEAQYRDFAVLYRANAQSNALEMAFARSGIPYRMLGGVRFSDRKEIRDLVAYLQLINNHDDRERLLRIVNEPRRKIGDKTLAAVQEIATYENTGMFAVMKRADSYVALARNADKLKDFCALIEELTAKIGQMPLDRFVDEVLERSGYRQMIRDMGPEEAERLDNLDEFISGVIEYQNSTDTPTLTEFLEVNALVADVDRYDDTADAVVMMTIHSAKGLEFPQVFLPGFEEGIFPGMQTIMAGEAEIEEERRLAYVAITRAKEMLYILHAKSRMLYGHTTSNPASRFLAEIPESLLERPRASAEEQAARFTYSAPTRHMTTSLQTAASDRISVGQRPTPRTGARTVFREGDRVKHPTFGEGDILRAQKMGADVLYEVAFDICGTKKLMGTYAKLTKI